MIFNFKKKKNKDPMNGYLNPHYITRSNWVRAAVLGANDGILSISSLAIGVAVASDIREPVVIATIAGLVAGALSMAAGEYISVSSQSDIEQADIEREKNELIDKPEFELRCLAKIYEKRGLKKETAWSVASELTENNALKAHIRDELGINEFNKANPLQAAFFSGFSFTLGGILPLLVTIFLPLNNMEFYIYCSTILFLIMLGTGSAILGGTKIAKSIARVTFWGTLSMGLTAFVGYLFGVAL